MQRESCESCGTDGAGRGGPNGIRSPANRLGEEGERMRDREGEEGLADCDGKAARIS